MSDYLPRIIDDELRELLTGSRAIVVEGARAVGKTATALRVASSVVRLDDPDTRQIVAAPRILSEASGRLGVWSYRQSSRDLFDSLLAGCAPGNGPMQTETVPAREGQAERHFYT